MTESDGQTIQQLHQALLSAFPDQASLSRMVRMGMNLNLATIAGADLSDTVFRLISWAESQGRTAELIEQANRQNPGNPDLRRLAQAPFSSQAIQRYLTELI